jgi:hypothetical protein
VISARTRKQRFAMDVSPRERDTRCRESLQANARWERNRSSRRLLLTERFSDSMAQVRRIFAGKSRKSCGGRRTRLRSERPVARNRRRPEP